MDIVLRYASNNIYYKFPTASFIVSYLICIVNFQFDALIERLTGRELLTMFARLRGVPESQIKEIVNIEIVRVDLTKLADKTCGTYR